MSAAGTSFHMVQQNLYIDNYIERGDKAKVVQY